MFTDFCLGCCGSADFSAGIPELLEPDHFPFELRSISRADVLLDGGTGAMGHHFGHIRNSFDSAK